MAGKQVILTTVFGAKAETIGHTFGTFAKVPNAELHVFVYDTALPAHRFPGAQYHLVQYDPAFVSVRRDALFRRWTLADEIGAEFALVVDGIDAACLQPLPPFRELLRGAAVAAATEWGGPVRLHGQGYTSAYLNAGVTFWNVPDSTEIRKQIAFRGRSHYRGPFDDQTALNEVLYTSYFDRLVILPPQFNWRACYRRNLRNWQRFFRKWPRVDSLNGVYIYHNQHCIDEVLRAMKAERLDSRAALPNLPVDRKPLTSATLFWRRLMHRLFYS